MSQNSLKPEDRSEKYPLNLAIVGGGKACQFFLEFLGSESSDYFNIVGVCDINPDAEGFRLAKEKGYHTTDNYRDLFNIEGLDVIIEITGSREVLLDLIRLKPKGVGVLEHNIGGILKRLSHLDQRLKFAEQQVAFEKRTSDFLIQQSDERIVVLNPDVILSPVRSYILHTFMGDGNDFSWSVCIFFPYAVFLYMESSKKTRLFYLFTLVLLLL